MGGAATITPVPETALVVDDDQDMCWVLEIALAGIGCAATTVGSGQRAISSLAEKAFPIAFVDARLPDMDGLRLIEELRSLQPSMRIFMISGYFLEDDLRIVEAVRAFEIDGFLAKPFRIDAIVAAVTGHDGNRRPC
jgi:DNA-binding NtrC family response regulator